MTISPIRKMILTRMLQATAEKKEIERKLIAKENEIAEIRIIFAALKMKENVNLNEND